MGITQKNYIGKGHLRREQQGKQNQMPTRIANFMSQFDEAMNDQIKYYFLVCS